MDPNETPIQKKLLSKADVKAIGIWQSNSTLLRLEARKRFPRRLRIGGVGVCYLRDEIEAWIEERAKERDRHPYKDPTEK